MTTARDEPGLDPLIHELPRLRICATLAAATPVEFRVLKQAADLSDSALSKHLRRLADAGYVAHDTGRPTGRGRPRTWVSLTAAGRAAYEQHVAALRDLTRRS